MVDKSFFFRFILLVKVVLAHMLSTSLNKMIDKSYLQNLQVFSCYLMALNKLVITDTLSTSRCQYSYGMTNEPYVFKKLNQLRDISFT